MPTADEQYLIDNANSEGVQSTDSGLQSKVLEEAGGNSPGASDTVEVHYEGWLIDGTVFDSSFNRGESISFPLNRVIPGWTEGLQLMNEGSTYELTIPSELGYGATGAGGDIPPHATLIFKVQLIGVK